MNGAQSFSAAIKESIKAMAQWSVYYFTSRERWYRVPETVQLHDLNFPAEWTSMFNQSLYFSTAFSSF